MPSTARVPASKCAMQKLAALPALNSMELRLPILLETEIGQNLQQWKKEERMRRLWAGDPEIWTGKDESHWLGWLDCPELEVLRLAKLKAFQEGIAHAGFKDVVVLGMGGSSLCPDVLSSTFEPLDQFPILHVLDSTNPDQIHELEEMLELRSTLFIVASKSGDTLEPGLFLDYFYSKVSQVLGGVDAGSRFVAITDSESSLEKKAQLLGFRRIFHGVKSIGGRYSALSDFGMVPAATMGMDTELFLKRALQMAHACSPNVPAEENPGLLLGCVLGTLGAMGKDKVTLICSPEIWNLGSWIEQLLAESTGKQGKALIPICEERLGPPSVYGRDRFFVFLKLDGSIDRESDAKINALEAAEFPVVRIELCDSQNLGQEFYRWEMATAVAGSILKINPFDQPDVESVKIETRRITSDFEGKGALPEEISLFEEGGIALYGGDGGQGVGNSLHTLLDQFLARLRVGDYFALLAYLPMKLEIQRVIESIRVNVRDTHKVATTVGFGPRYLHSTGQAHKGGPSSGVFLMITADSERDLPIPSHHYSFGVIQAAQARADFKVLSSRKRRLLRVHLKTEPGKPGSLLEKLTQLAKAVEL